MYYVTKNYDHTLGMSTCFRQPQAKSHCRDPHGYPLAFKLTFEAHTLNDDHWVIDFGGLKPIKQWLADTFDHKTILAEDDPALEDFRALYAKYGFADILTLPFVGCEGFAKYVYQHVQTWLDDKHCLACDVRGLRLVSVEAREHGGNSAIYTGER